MQALHLLAPISGQTVQLESVPDPVFSEKLTGDGLAILADGDTVLAPCDGEITLFFDTKHAFAITTPDGVQVLVHVGLDTIIMNGDGLTALKHSGEKVTAGTPILKLDRALLEKIKKVIDENADIIIKRWKEHFEKYGRRNAYED